MGIIIPFSSTHSPPHPAPSPSAGPPRRTSPSATARCRRTASPSLFLDVRLRGELYLALEHAMPLPLAPLRLRFSGAALRRRRRRRAQRACARDAPRVPWPRPRRGQGLWPCLDPAWVGRLPVGPTCRPLADGCGRIRVYLAFLLGFLLDLFICNLVKSIEIHV